MNDLATNTVEPVVTTPSSTPCHLSDKQLSHYNKRGFVIVPGVFSSTEIKELNTAVDYIREHRNDDDNERQKRELKTHYGQKPWAVFALGLRSGIIKEICQDEKILTLIEDIVKPGIAIFSAKMVEKPAHYHRLCHWHQDNAYYNEKCKSDCRMSVWLPLQDTDEHNGALWVVPGSHKEEILAWEDRKPAGHCSRSFAHGSESRNGEMLIPMKAGDLLLFHANLHHRSLENSTNKNRRAIIISYQEAIAGCGSDEQYKILRQV